MMNCLSSLWFSSCELTRSSFVLPFLQLFPCQDALSSVYMLIFFPGFFLLPISGLLNFHENMMVDASRCKCLIVLLHTCFCFWCNGQIVALLAPLVYSEFLFIRLMPFHVIQSVLFFLYLLILFLFTKNSFDTQVYADGTTTMSTHERKASIREFYGKYIDVANLVL